MFPPPAGRPFFLFVPKTLGSSGYLRAITKIPPMGHWFATSASVDSGLTFRRSGAKKFVTVLLFVTVFLFEYLSRYITDGPSQPIIVFHVGLYASTSCIQSIIVIKHHVYAMLHKPIYNTVN